jgi:hypothetical protein
MFPVIVAGIVRFTEHRESRKGRRMKSIKRGRLIIAVAFIGVATLAYAQQQHRRQHLICPTDGAQMSWTGNQKGGMNPSCEFSHVAYTADGKRADHKAWESCAE